MEHLKRIEDLTRRYANTRVGGAGLGASWALIVITLLMGLLWNHIYTEFLATGNTYSGLWQFLNSDILITPTWLKIAAISTSMLTWFGITCIQFFVDRRFGIATSNDSSAMLMRFLVPILFILFVLFGIGYDVGKTLAISENTGKSALEMMDISSYLGGTIITAWGVLWVFNTPDTSSRALACLLTIMLFPIMSSTLNEIDFINAIPQLIILIVFTILGLRQFLAYQNVRNEINALPVTQ